MVSNGLVLYGTSGCHLCELAENFLLQWVSQGWQVELIDIADDDQLLERFALSIPVLEHVASQRHLVWPFDAKAIHYFLDDENLA